MSNKWEFTLRAIGIICTFIFICISCIACFFFNNKIGNIEVNNIKIIVNKKSEILYPNDRENIEFMKKWLNNLRKDRGSFAYMYISFAPTEIELFLSDIRISFGSDDLIVYTKDNSNTYIQSVKKMDDFDLKMKEHLQKIIEKEKIMKNYSFPVDIRKEYFQK
ncbi:hypothetical protein [Victivallis sp. Marseille-Q1083]|uniref:hypothetical protein n=1 Tax=Victivallis sp. Marseille-Q1083 TaxID=2717288 RepID=UPI00158C3F5A|nr:hypothetical protein [Victivallis sp. Marseille-Q1083]